MKWTRRFSHASGFLKNMETPTFQGIGRIKIASNRSDSVRKMIAFYSSNLKSKVCYARKVKFGFSVKILQKTSVHRITDIDTVVRHSKKLLILRSLELILHVETTGLLTGKLKSSFKHAICEQNNFVAQETVKFIKIFLTMKHHAVSSKFYSNYSEENLHSKFPHTYFFCLLC